MHMSSEYYNMIIKKCVRPSSDGKHNIATEREEAALAKLYEYMKSYLSFY